MTFLTTSKGRLLRTLKSTASLAFVSILLTLSPFSLAQTLPDGTYTITSRFSEKAIDVASASTEDGANIQLYSDWGGTHQQWNVTSLGNGYYSLRAAHSGKSMDVFEWCSEPGCEIRQWEYLGGTNQQWEIVDAGSGYYKIVSRYNGMPLDVYEWNEEDGADLRQWSDTGGTNQQWAFSPVDGGGNDDDVTDGDFYVSPSGNDTSAGSLNQPFRTLQHAIDVAEPGDLVYVRGGVYNISNRAVTGDRDSAGVHFWKSGTSDSNRIRYFAYPGETPVLDFENLNIRQDPYHTHGVWVTGSYLHLKGFEIRNVPMNTRSNTALRVGNHNNNETYGNIFELLNIHHNQGSGVFVHTTLGGHEFLNVDSHNNYDPWSHQGDGENADGFGVHYQWQGEPIVFRGCRAWWNSDDGWDFISQEVPVTVENSWAMGNGYINSGSDVAGNGAGFKIGSSKTGIRHIVRNNVAWGNRNQGFYANHSSGGNDWYNNTSFNNRVQYDMLASSWDSNGNRTDGVILTGNDRHYMRNNIAYPHDNRNMAGVDDQYNTWNLGITPNSGDFLTTSDEDFRSPRQSDGSLPELDFMKLSPNSQMIDRGVDVGLPFSGSAPDLGAYQR